MKKSFSSPRFITYSHTHLHLHEKWTPMLNAIHSCHFTLKLCSLVFSIIMTMIPPHDQMSCSHFSIRCYCYVVGSRRLMPLDALQHKAYCTTLVFSRSYLHHQVSPPETLVVKEGTTWARNGRWILPENARLSRNIQDLLHGVNLRHVTQGFTSFPKEGVLRIFSLRKIRRL